MYTTAISIDHTNKTFSITCRDFKKGRTKHWKPLGETKVTYSELDVSKVFDIVYTGGKEAAQKNKLRFEDAFELAGYKKVQIKN